MNGFRIILSRSIRFKINGSRKSCFLQQPSIDARPRSASLAKPIVPRCPTNQCSTKAAQRTVVATKQHTQSRISPHQKHKRSLAASCMCGFAATWSRAIELSRREEGSCCSRHVPVTIHNGSTVLDGLTEKVSVYALTHSQYMRPFKLIHLTAQAERARPASAASGPEDPSQAVC
jgi:hypothetical protein